MLEDYIDVREVARRLGVHPETVLRNIRIGRLPAEKIGLKWFIKLEDFNIFASTYNPRSGRRRKLL